MIEARFETTAKRHGEQDAMFDLQERSCGEKILLLMTVRKVIF